MKKTSTKSSGAFNKYLVSILTVLSFTFSKFVSGGMIKKVSPALLRNGLRSLLVCMAFWLAPSIAKADTPIPTSVVSNYDPILHRLTLTVQWTWGSTANTKYVTAAVFADLNGDGISPTLLDNPATYNSGGNAFPAGLSARDEFLGQLAISSIEGTASSSIYPAGDRTDNGIAAQNGFGPLDPRVLFPYGTTGAGTVGSSGTFTLTYDNVSVTPTRICVVMYDVHEGDLDKLSGGHSPRSAGTGRNTDNSVEDGNTQGTVSCSNLVVLRCAVNKTEVGCQTQSAINTSYAAWLASVTASGCNGVLTNNSTGAPSATGGSKTVTFTYTQNGCPNQLAVTTCTATFTVLSCTTTTAPVYNPDINVTYVNVPVPGNVQTNDVVPSGTAYGTPVALSGNPAGGNITMNTDGTYSFVSPNVGVYRYNVPVCVPGQAAPCPTTLLTITVLGPNSNNNPPVANTDIATTKLNTAVTLKSLANDYAGNPGGTLNPFTVVVTVNPLHGTYTVNNSNGDITYTPATGYSGMDTLTYRVCDNTTPTALCATALQIITIKAAGAPNSTAAADDYVFTPINTAVTGNAMTNDTDPEGNSQSITAQTTTIAGKGTLVLNSNGTFTFTPVSGFSGPVNFAYTTTDNGSPVATAKATIYILVSPAPSSTNPDFNSTFVNVPVPGNVSTNDRVPAGTSYGTSPTLLSSPAGSTPTLAMNANGTYTFVSNIKGVYIYDVPVCMPGQTAPCPPTKLTITVLDAGGVTNSPVANVDIAVTRINTPVTLRSLANDAAGNPSNMLVPSSVTVTVAPLHGTATVNAATGDITYTPAAGYTGTDTLTYQVCDDQFSPKCATANQIITIMPLGAPNTTEAADDYKITAHNTVATGNVKINDTDPEGNTQTVTAQNTTVAGKGTLVLGTNGDYTFTPVTGFSGPVDFTYTTCDNGIPQACATATLHILVRPASGLPDLTPSIFNDGTTLNRNTTRDNVIRIFNIGPGATTAPITFTIPKMLPAFEITINPNETMVDVFGGMPVTNNQWTIVEQASRYVFTSKPGVVIASGAFNDIGLKVKAVGIVNSTGNLSIQIVFGTGGGETPFNNNSDNNTYSIN